MKKLLILGAFFIFVGEARAQTPQQPDPISALADDWNAYQNAQKHVIASVSAVATELQKARSDLAAVTKERDELKAERDKLKADVEKKP